MKKIYAILFALLLSSQLWSQRASDWQQQFDDKIENLVIDPYSGYVIVETTTGISALDPETKQILWNYKNTDLGFRKLKLLAASAVLQTDLMKYEDYLRIELIPNTSLFMLTKGNNFLILELQSGDIKYSTKDAKVSLLSKTYIPEKNVMIALVSDDKDYKVVAFDTQAMQVVWTQIIEPGTIEQIFTFGYTPYDGPEPKIDKEGNFLLSFNKSLFNIDSKTGDIKWVKAGNIKFFDYSPQTNSVIIYETSDNTLGDFASFDMLEKGVVSVIDNGSGKLRFEPMKVKGLTYMQDFDTDFMMATKNGLNRYDYISGSEIWDKSPKGKNFSKVIKTPNNYYLYTANGKMNAVDSKGKQQWKKSIEITDEDDSETLVLDYTNNNIVYVTETDANIVDIRTGEKKWKKDLKLKYDKKRPSVADYDEDSRTYFIYNNEKMYKFKESDQQAPDEFAKIKVKREKQIRKLFIADNTVVVSGVGELIGLDKSGNVLYNHFYQEPGAGLRIAGRIGGLAAGFASGLAGSAIFPIGGALSDKGLFNRPALGGLGSQVMSNLAFLGAAKLKKRFEGNKKMNEFSFFLDREQDQNLLIKVNNASGEEVDKLLLSNTRPIYEIDPFTQSIFYAKGNNLEVFE